MIRKINGKSMSFNPVDVSFQSTSDSDKKPTCAEKNERECADGSCVLRNSLCQEEEVVNENTILIMIVVGMAVVIFLIILYCFQQKTRSRANSTNRETVLEDGDNSSLYNPPPPYDEVITSSLYPPTPEFLRQTRIPSSEEPITPPPNYETALDILAKSHDSVFTPKTKSSVFRRSVSVDSVSQQNRTIQRQSSRLPSIGR